KRLKMVPETEEQLKPYTQKISAEKQKQLFSAYADYPSRDGILDIITDGIFTVPSVKFADAQSSHAPTYMYRFDWTSGGLRMVGLKACHGLELPFVFGTLDTKLGKMVQIMADKKRVRQLSEQVQQSWLSFAKTGNPNSNSESGWKPYNVASRNTLIFDKSNYIANDPENQKLKAWDGVNIF
ncbi:MAG TPA: carboxylesterase family protein, partial [Chitinophagales bacterium]|nr:carboxylesterase family protein [Chitinophagales bacterium]